MDERVITIEDTPEWHYGELHPGHDCVELRINEQMDYSSAIKTCLRLNPKWIMLSETRSGEVVHLVESLSTGVKGMTTLHTSDVRNIPDRMLNMAGTSRDATRFENDIYAFVDVGILVRRGSRRSSTGQEEIRRFVDQVCLFHREQGQNSLKMLVEDGELLADIPNRGEEADAAKPAETTPQKNLHRKGTYYEAKSFAG
jgi:pilus assembly protein CpaF